MTSSGDSYNKLKSLILYRSKFDSRYGNNILTGRKSGRKGPSEQHVKTNRSLGSTTRTSYTGTRKNDQKTPQLHKSLTTENIEQLHHHFKQLEIGKMDRRDLRDTLEKFNIYYADDEFENLFLKTNTNRDDMVDWDEIVSYMLLGFEDDFGDNAKESLDSPIKEKPVIRRTRQRYQIIKIDFFPAVLSGQILDMNQGVFVTIAIDGTVNFYDLDWELKRVGKSPSRKYAIAIPGIDLLINLIN